MQFDNNIPIYIQVKDKIKQNIVLRKIKTGEKLLSARDFSKQIGVNLNTVAKVYKELENECIVYTKRGLGTFVTDSEDKIKLLQLELANELVTKFLKGMKNIGYDNKKIYHILNSKMEVNNIE